MYQSHAERTEETPKHTKRRGCAAADFLCFQWWSFSPKGPTTTALSESRLATHKEAALVRGKHFENYFPLRHSLQKLFDILVFLNVFVLFVFPSVRFIDTIRLPLFPTPEGTIAAERSPEENWKSARVSGSPRDADARERPECAFPAPDASAE